MTDGENVKREKEASADALTITVKSQQGADVHFKIKRTAKLGKMFAAFALKKSVDAKYVRFLHEGHHVNADQTAEQVGLEDGDVLDAMMEQLGGGR